MGEVIVANKYEGVKLNEYKDTFSLEAHRENNGQYWPVWAKYRKGKDAYQDKDWPVKVALGDRETAIGILLMLLKELGYDIDSAPF